MTALLGQCVLNSAGAMNGMMALLFQSMLASQCKISPNSMWPPDYGKHVLKSGMIGADYDYVVIGGGSAGSVLATELSNNPKHKVLVLEEGKNPPQESEIPNLYSTLQKTEYCHNTLIQSNGRSCKAYKNGQCVSARGNVLGGSGSINGMLYVRGNSQDYDSWLSLGNEGWGYNDVMPIFKQLEQPNAQGYVHLEHFRQYDKDVVQLIVEGGKELGINQVEDFVDPNFIGYSQIRGTIQNGRRASTAKTFLAAVQKRDNLDVIKEAKVDRLLFNEKGTKAVGVVFKLQGKKNLTVTAKKEVILAAGAIGTPEILMRSGVGPKEVLQPLNISIVRELPVGENLQDHVMAEFFVSMDSLPDNITDPITNQLYEYLSDSTGPLSSTGITSLVGFINADSDTRTFRIKKTVDYPNVGLYHSIIPKDRFLDTPAFKMNKKEALHFLETTRNKDILAIYTMALHPKSRGNVKLASASPSVASTINANYLAEPEDVKTLVAGCKFVKSLINSAPFQARNAQSMHIPIKECDVHKFMSDEYCECFVSYYTMSGYHYSGTVKMGSNTDKTACVDPHLKLKGFENIRVADASIMPLVTSANTNGPTIMIAKKAADMIANDWKKVL